MHAHAGGTRPTLQRLVFELDAPLPGGNNSATSSSAGRCISSERLMQRTLEFPSVSWDAHGQQHAYIYCCADTVNNAFHWGPTQCVLKLSFDLQQQQQQQLTREGGGSQVRPRGGERGSTVLCFRAGCEAACCVSTRAADTPSAVSIAAAAAPTTPCHNHAAQQPLAHITHPPVRTELWDAGSRRFVVEPLFVPRPGGTAEDEGWVLAVLHNADSGAGELVILDAQAIAAGPLATIRLRHHLPAGLHGSWSSQVLLQHNPEALRADAWLHPHAVRAV
jgi:carotenoid cleavage dioxygenase-like enzyme